MRDWIRRRDGGGGDQYSYGDIVVYFFAPLKSARLKYIDSVFFLMNSEGI